ncbi:MAG: hypothetical protein JRH20_24455 [Deltaproteobacteria bacterium]|nr:hypothetical protein [Deltaproteobacteria bacterium]
MRPIIAVALGLAVALVAWHAFMSEDSTSPSQARTQRAASSSHKVPSARPWLGARYATASARGAENRSPTQLTPDTFADSRIPLERRREMLVALGRTGDASAVRLLMATGNDKAYLRWAAIAALGTIRPVRSHAAIATYLEGKLDDTDSRTAEAAVRAYGQVWGAKAVEGIAGVMRRAQKRPDGLGALIVKAGVETLGEIATTDAMDVLRDDRSAQDWDFEHGTHVVQALARMGGTRCRDALMRYADHLQSQLPADPMARAYFEEKIAEARAGARRIAG